MREFFFYLDLSHAQCMAYYQGVIDYVQVVEDGGKKIRFPASRVRPFISTIGVRGRFRLILNDSNQFVSLEKVT
ncbi:DUF2835 family protein [Pseudoalteromonas fenneropenaei]|uniref:DUF2835 family protein n=1 Tax=Pseudoalteromonas fenneropenaei TaxID=1737459 RepID=A0ABV7CHN8_9GAMM